MKRTLHHPCLAGHDPASHPIEGVGTQRVALVDDSMRLRVKARKDIESEQVDTQILSFKVSLCRKRWVWLIKKAGWFRKQGILSFFLIRDLVVSKIRVPLCSKKRNVFSIHFAFPLEAMVARNAKRKKLFKQ